MYLNFPGAFGIRSCVLLKSNQCKGSFLLLFHFSSLTSLYFSSLHFTSLLLIHFSFSYFTYFLFSYFIFLLFSFFSLTKCFSTFISSYIFIRVFKCFFFFVLFVVVLCIVSFFSYCFDSHFRLSFQTFTSVLPVVESRLFDISTHNQRWYAAHKALLKLLYHTNLYYCTTNFGAHHNHLHLLSPLPPSITCHYVGWKS